MTAPQLGQDSKQARSWGAPTLPLGAGDGSITA
jgi:hypothetical protein